MRSIQEIGCELKERIKRKEGVLLITGDKGSTLLLDILKGSNIKSLFIDTGIHFDEVVEYIKDLEKEVDIINSKNTADVTPDNMVKCCRQRKAEPLKKYLYDIKAEYIVVPFTEEDKRNGLEDSYLNGLEGIEIIRPLYDVADRDIWVYIKEHSLAFTSLYRKGYKVIDCRECTTRIGRRRPDKETDNGSFDSETIEKLKSLGYM